MIKGVSNSEIWKKRTVGWYVEQYARLVSLFERPILSIRLELV